MVIIVTIVATGTPVIMVINLTLVSIATLVTVVRNVSSAAPGSRFQGAGKRAKN